MIFFDGVGILVLTLVEEIRCLHAFAKEILPRTDCPSVVHASGNEISKLHTSGSLYNCPQCCWGIDMIDNRDVTPLYYLWLGWIVSDCYQTVFAVLGSCRVRYLRE